MCTKAVNLITAEDDYKEKSNTKNKHRNKVKLLQPTAELS